jgi:hypothetical protein
MLPGHCLSVLIELVEAEKVTQQRIFQRFLRSGQWRSRPPVEKYQPAMN